MPGIWSGTDCWVHDDTSEKDAREKAGDRLELAAGHSDKTPTTGTCRHIPNRYEAAPLTLSWLPRVL